MRKKVVIFAFLVFVGILFARVTDQGKADLVVLNGRVFTIAEENPEIQAIAVKDGKILALGNTQTIKTYVGPSTTMLDVGRKFVLPGFIDAHCHFSSGGRSLSMLDLSNETSVAYIQEKIAERIKRRLRENSFPAMRPSPIRISMENWVGRPKRYWIRFPQIILWSCAGEEDMRYG